MQSAHSHLTQITRSVLTGTLMSLCCGTIPLLNLLACFWTEIWNKRPIIVICIINWEGHGFYWQFQYQLIDLLYRFALVKYNSKTKAFFNSTIQVKFNWTLWRGKTSRIVAWNFENSLPLFLQFWVSHNWKSIISEISIERGNSKK